MEYIKNIFTKTIDDPLFEECCKRREAEKKAGDINWPNICGFFLLLFLLVKFLQEFSRLVLSFLRYLNYSMENYEEREIMRRG
jgi:hypothetical protein